MNGSNGDDDSKPPLSRDIDKKLSRDGPKDATFTTQWRQAMTSRMTPTRGTTTNEHITPPPRESLYNRFQAALASGERKPRFPKGIRPRGDGLVAVGGDLSPEMLVEAYSRGYFPWSGEPPIPWYCPQPRMLLFPDYIHISRSLKKCMRKGRLTVSFNQDFRGVIEQCAKTPRAHEKDTWITSPLIEAYCRLHEHAIAQSVEVYQDGVLCGGLYGLTLGHAFFGESMFSHVSNASKVALVSLAAYLRERNFDFIDCQVATPHLMRMGAHPIPRRGYMALLKRALQHPSHHYLWEAEPLNAASPSEGIIHPPTFAAKDS